MSPGFRSSTRARAFNGSAYLDAACESEESLRDC